MCFWKNLFFCQISSRCISLNTNYLLPTRFYYFFLLILNYSSIFKSFYFLIYVFYLNIYLYSICVSYNACKLSCDFWELNLGPPEEQPALLTSRLSLQSWLLLHFEESLLWYYGAGSLLPSLCVFWGLSCFVSLIGQRLLPMSHLACPTYCCFRPTSDTSWLFHIHHERH